MQAVQVANQPISIKTSELEGKEAEAEDADQPIAIPTVEMEGKEAEAEPPHPNGRRSPDEAAASMGITVLPISVHANRPNLGFGLEAVLRRVGGPPLELRGVA